MLSIHQCIGTDIKGTSICLEKELMKTRMKTFNFHEENVDGWMNMDNICIQIQSYVAYCHVCI